MNKFYLFLFIGLFIGLIRFLFECGSHKHDYICDGNVKDTLMNSTRFLLFGSIGFPTGYDIADLYLNNTTYNVFSLKIYAGVLFAFISIEIIDIIIKLLYKKNNIER